MRSYLLENFLSAFSCRVAKLSAVCFNNNIFSHEGFVAASVMGSGPESLQELFVFVIREAYNVSFYQLFLFTSLFT